VTPSRPALPFDWQLAFRDALRAGLVEEAQRAALLALFADEWSRIRAVAGRRLDHDACTAVAVCVEQKVASYHASASRDGGSLPVEVERPWGLLRVLVWQCLHRKQRKTPALMDDLPEVAFDDALDLRVALRMALPLCFDQLPEDARVVLAPHVTGLGDPETAMRLGIPQTTLRTRRRRALQALRECLEKRGITVDGGEDD